MEATASVEPDATLFEDAAVLVEAAELLAAVLDEEELPADADLLVEAVELPHPASIPAVIAAVSNTLTTCFFIVKSLLNHSGPMDPLLYLVSSTGYSIGNAI